MTIKKPVARIAAIVLAFVIGGAMVQAQSVASTNESDTNTETARTGSSAAATNAPSAAHSADSVPAVTANQENSSDESARNANNGNHAGSRSDRGGNHSQNIVALASILSPFIMVVAIIFTVVYFQHRRNKMMHETLRSMIEKGMPITPEILAGLGGKHPTDGDPSGKQAAGNPFDQVFPRRQKARNQHLFPGLVLTGIGLALTGFHVSRASAGSLIILFIGVAFLIVWLVERKQDNDQQPPKI